MTLTAVLLVGGESRRMGADKAALTWAGEPLWRRQVRTLQELKPHVLWVSSRARPAWCPPDTEAVLDQEPSQGPLSGLAATLAKAWTTHLFALAVDMPCMTAEHLRQLWSLARPGCGVLPMNGESAEPLCAIYPVDPGVVAAAREALRGSHYSLHQFTSLLEARKQMLTFPIPAPDRQCYLNVNTMVEFAQGAPL
jgi:molybdopterin-guanine dinucleotide biosynthesis protein A